MPKLTRTLLKPRSPVLPVSQLSMLRSSKAPASRLRRQQSQVPQSQTSQSQALHSHKSSPLPMLLTESRQEYKRMRRALRQDIDPHGAIERSYVADIAHLEWEIKRLRRAEVAMLNTAFRAALEKLLTQLMRRPDEEEWEVDDKAAALAFDWFGNAETKKRVTALLAGYGLDTTAIEAKVLQVCGTQLVAFEQLLTSAEARRTKAVRALAEYRAMLKRHLANTGAAENQRAAGDHTANGKILALGFRGKKTSVA